MRRYAVASPDLLRQLPKIDDLEARFCSTPNGTDDRWTYAVCWDGLPVGSVAVRMRGMRVGWCSYWIAAAFRGRGLASAALRSMADYAFGSLDAFRLELAHRLDNPASGIVADRAGFVPEGVMRSELEYDGIRYDTKMWSRLKTDPRPNGYITPIPS